MSLCTPFPILLYLCRSDDLLAGCITLNSCMRLSYAAPHLSLLLLIKFLNFCNVCFVCRGIPISCLCLSVYLLFLFFPQVMFAGIIVFMWLILLFTRGERVVYCFGLVCLSGKFRLTINVCPSGAYLEMTWYLASRF